jgi:hypothetical protein
MYEMGVSGHNIIYDYSGNGRSIDCAVLNAPVLTADVLYGHPGWYFNGSTTVPLNWTGSIFPKHVFILASNDEAAFTTNRGLVGGETSGDILLSESSGTKFFDLTPVVVSYVKNGVLYAQNNMQAPVNGDAALIEVSNSGGFGLDGLQVGRQRDLAGRIWKGYIFEVLFYDSVLTSTEVERIRLYFNIKFSAWQLGLPFYFPSDDLMQFKRSRFYAEPLRYQDITDSYEYEDRGRTFNEVADTPPRRWQYNYLARTPEQTVIFDEFWNQARIANPFIFRDKYGTEWTDVRILQYNRSHVKHMSWKNDIEFDLIKYP